jgi:hypothetical protein
MNMQNVGVLILAALAAVFLGFRVVGPLVRRSVPSSCHGCSAACGAKTSETRQPCDTRALTGPLRIANAPTAGEPR